METKLYLLCIVFSAALCGSGVDAAERKIYSDQNPGTQTRDTDPPDLDSLMEYCNSNAIADVWYQLAIELFNPEDEAEVLSIYRNDTLTESKAKCQAMLSTWKLKDYSSWNRLINAIELDAVSDHELPRKLRKRFLVSSTKREDDFAFANYYGDHMVLQKAPARAKIWGHLRGSLKDKTATCTFNNTIYNPTLTRDSEEELRWSILLDPTEPGGPYTISCTAGPETITLSDVLFGDVWVCSGQSNMVYNVRETFNGLAEVSRTVGFPNIRIFVPSLGVSTTPQREVAGVQRKWSSATPETINGGFVFTHFSAVCFFYGRNLFQILNYPIGLIQVAYVDTPVESWSSPDVIEQCDPEIPFSVFRRRLGSRVWNAMLYPFLSMTIYGVIYYQGEANVDTPETYGCMFPAMIEDWRAKWHAASDGTTNEMFPFGFVQLHAATISTTSITGFPEIRWHQTADFGYVPNPRQQNVFMSVAIDIGDPQSIFGALHPRNKQDVAKRLAFSGRAIAYGEDIYYTGPIADTATITGTNTVTIEYRNVSGSLEQRSPSGFEINCSNPPAEARWVDAPIQQIVQPNQVIISGTCEADETVTQVRYAWRDNPCVTKLCAIYSGDLPSPPFIMSITTGT